MYKVKNVSLNALCEMYDAPVNPMKDQLKNVYRRDQRYWARRPLTRDMMLYAAADVLALVPQVYNAMTRSVAVLWLKLWKGPATAVVEAKFNSHYNIHRRSKQHLVLNPRVGTRLHSKVVIPRFQVYFGVKNVLVNCECV